MVRNRHPVAWFVCVSLCAAIIAVLGAGFAFESLLRATFVTSPIRPTKVVADHRRYSTTLHMAKAETLNIATATPAGSQPVVVTPAENAGPPIVISQALRMDPLVAAPIKPTARRAQWATSVQRPIRGWRISTDGEGRTRWIYGQVFDQPGN